MSLNRESYMNNWQDLIPLPQIIHYTPSKYTVTHTSVHVVHTFDTTL